LLFVSLEDAGQIWVGSNGLESLKGVTPSTDLAASKRILANSVSAECRCPTQDMHKDRD
jgi:hypothetical protein